MAQTVFEHLKKELQLDVDSATACIAQGGVKSYEDYKRTVGKIEGLSLALSLITDL